MDHSKAQIIATLGPASAALDTVRSLVKAGMDAARLDFADGTLEEHRRAILNARVAAAEHDRRIPLIGDLAGARQKREFSRDLDSSALAPFTEYDYECASFCAEQEVDYLALSCVGLGRDIEDFRACIFTEGYQPGLIAKIERKETLRNLSEVVTAADAVMIARGDLGNEIPLEQIPYLQHEIIKRLNWVRKPVIVATDMLLSMIEHPQPTRAEVSDVAYAIISGADAVMLSEETAVGQHPVEAVSAMEQIIKEAERHIPESNVHLL